MLDEVDSYAIFEAAGVPVAEHAVVTVGEPCTALPVPGPTVVKILSADVAHKSDIGGVVLNVQDARGVRLAIDDICVAVSEQAPGIVVDRLVVQSMAHGVGEALVGYRLDADAGPIVLVAAGGVLAELYHDRSVRLAPVDLDVAREMVAEVVAFRALDGYRGAPRGDLEALAKAIVSVSRLALSSGGPIIEAEVNPLLVLRPGEGVVAVDALVRRAVISS
ncbi:acetate--CoA ligase family protein [Aeromicrobium sp. UC242_57]